MAPRAGFEPATRGLTGRAPLWWLLRLTLLLLLGAYDKGQDVAKKRQQEEIKVARARLKDWEQRQRVEAKAAKRAPAPRPKK